MHAHLLIVPKDAEQMVTFLCHASRNISDEIGRLHDWPSKKPASFMYVTSFGWPRCDLT